MSQSLDRLYELLPAVYRRRDAEQGYPLQALLRVIAEQVNVVEDDIAQLYENWFIETCQDWVVPYIGDLSGYRLVHEAGEPGEVTMLAGKQLNQILIPRREVANTIGFRRRKGTLALLELLANDVAGWPARAVEFYRRLGWTQPLNHQHPTRGRTVALRNGAALDRVDGPFDTLAHTVEVRRIAAPLSQGRYNIPSVGVLVWRLKPYSVTYTHAYCLEKMAPHCYTFSVLGNDTPLYNRPQPELEPTHIAGELNLPTPIRRRAFEQRVIAGGRIVSTQVSDAYYGPDKSLAIWVPDWPKKGAKQPVPAQAIIPADLSQWHYRAPRNHVAVDPKLGRIVFPAGQLPKQGVWVSYQYAFSADIGGGEYDRPLSQPSIPTVSLFRGDDLEDSQALAVRLGKTPTPDPVSRYLWENFSSITQQLLGAYDGIGQPSATLQAALLEELNQRLTDAALYDEQRFDGIDPGPEATALLALNPTGQQLLRLNRLLLEAAYPGILARSYLIYRVDGNDSLVEALQRWQSDHPRHAVIEITASGVYVERLPLLQLRQGQDLQIRAANGARPVIRLLDYQTDLPDSLSVQGATGSRFTLDGLLITGRSLQISGPEVDASLPPVQGDLCKRHDPPLHARAGLVAALRLRTEALQRTEPGAPQYRRAYPY